MAVFYPGGYPDVLDAITGTIERDVISTVPLQVLHRHLDDRDVYFVFNPSG